MAKYILLDTETTGTQEQDRIIQLGFMVLGDGKIQTYSEFFSSQTPISFAAMEVHGITQEMIEGKPTCKESMSYNKLLELNEPQNYIIIHNAPFDLGMLEKEGFELKMKLIDTLRVAKHLMPEEEAHRLQYFRYKLGLYKQEEDEAKKLNIQIKAHDAIGDVLVLKLLLSKLKEMVCEKFPNKNPVEVMVELTQKPIFIEKFKFGKYKNKTLQEVANSDPSYLQWMLNNMENLDEDMRWSIKQVI